MHTNRISPARKFLLALAAATILALFAGCQAVVLSNLTAPSLPENPSQIYTITLRVTPKAGSIDRGSISPKIVVDGAPHPMTKSPIGENLWLYEYHLPPGRDDIAYYFLVNYTMAGNEGPVTGEAYSELTHASVVHRYVLSLEVNRGPVGARVSVLGRGFTPQDRIFFGDTPVRTVFESSNSLSFFVPAVAVERDYAVTVGGTAGSSPVGTFHVDPSSLSVVPSALTLRTGEIQSLTFTIQNAAPAGGLLIDVTTDAPESVIMPEVIVPQGQTSVTVNVEGGKPGSGSLFLKGYGAGEMTIPITVTAK